MRTALRTAFATALVAGVVATPVLVTGSAFAAETTPAPKAAATETATAAAASEGTLVRTVQLAGGLSAKVYVHGDQHPYYTATVLTGDGTVLGELKAGGEYPEAESEVFAGYTVTLDNTGKVTAVAATSGTLLRTVQLAGGLSAKVYARGDQHRYYTATVLKGGTVLGELKAGAGYPDKETLPFAGYLVTLDSTGEVTAVAQSGTLIRTVQLAGGLSAKVYARGDQHRYYTATVLKGGTVLGELKAGAGYPQEQTEVFAGYAVTLDSTGKVTAVKAPSAEPTPGPVVALGRCTVQQDVPSVFALLTVTLTNDLEKGPKAVLKDEAGKPILTLDRDHAADLGAGLTIKGANTTTPQLGQRTQGGVGVPFQWTAFPKLPKGCEKGSATTPAGNTGNTGTTGTTGNTTNTGQTSVIPQGGVAAGAEFAAEGDSTALIASGVGAASLAAAGLGFVVLRRRSAAARV
ncbi:hypothetical protein ACH4A8_17570 [Streptomyces vietnamensis]|uniref:hypothetical protein n=1 Tax=Streptomyces vietnamensis TaxID=362257 RepID=UPI0037B88534